MSPRSILLLLPLLLTSASAASSHWAASWTASVHGPYPAGNASAQPDLRFAFPSPATGAHDQTFRLIVRPDIWANRARLRFSNAFGTKPITFDGVFAGLHSAGGAVVKGTNHPVHFNGGKLSITIAAGDSVWSDPVTLAVPNPSTGRKLAVSFHIAGESGPMTWHAKALTTSYLTAPGAGSTGGDDAETAFPFTTTSWYFLDAVEMASNAQVIVCFGDSITDGTASTLNGDDRWPDALSRRLHAAYGDKVSVVNAGIGGNRVVGPAEYSAAKPVSGGPSARQRLERDVLSLSGVSTVIWLEAINDFAQPAALESVEAVEAAMKEVAGRLRARIPGIKIIGATVVPALGSKSAGSQEVETKRKALNEFIRHSGGVFEAVADFDAATRDEATGELRREFVPDSTTGGPGDKLHPNRAGYLAMAGAVDLKSLVQ